MLLISRDWFTTQSLPRFVTRAQPDSDDPKSAHLQNKHELKKRTPFLTALTDILALQISWHCTSAFSFLLLLHFPFSSNPTFNPHPSLIIVLHSNRASTPARSFRTLPEAEVRIHIPPGIRPSYAYCVLVNQRSQRITEKQGPASALRLVDMSLPTLARPLCRKAGVRHLRYMLLGSRVTGIVTSRGRYRRWCDCSIC